ncbi:MAG: hypothetical protein ACXVCY_04255 [Pseudobdellovibrionaceae bacterium]
MTNTDIALNLSGFAIVIGCISFLMISGGILYLIANNRHPNWWVSGALIFGSLAIVGLGFGLNVHAEGTIEGIKIDLRKKASKSLNRLETAIVNGNLDDARLYFGDLKGIVTGEPVLSNIQYNSAGAAAAIAPERRPVGKKTNRRLEPASIAH